MRRQVIGRDVPATAIEPARLPGFVLRRAHAGAYPILLQLAGRMAAGELVSGISAREAARLDAYEGDGYRRCQRPVLLGDGRSVPAEVYLARVALRATARPWDLQTWQRCEKQAFMRAHGWPVRAGRRARTT